MNTKSMLLSLAILISSFVCYSNSEMTIQEQDQLIDSLYLERGNLGSLDMESMNFYTQVLIERKASLKYALVHQVGFFKNYEMFKGVFGTQFSIGFLAKSLLVLFCSYAGPRMTDIQYTPDDIKETFKNYDTDLKFFHYVLGPVCIAQVVFGGWILKNSLENLYIGWTRKKHSLAKLAKIDELLILLKDVKINSAE